MESTADNRQMERFTVFGSIGDKINKGDYMADFDKLGKAKRYIRADNSRRKYAIVDSEKRRVVWRYDIQETSQH